MTCHFCGSSILVEAIGTLSTNRPAPEQACGLPTVAGYEILEVLGRGGMGVVYKARQRNLERLVALKMILTAEHAGLQERFRFRSEAEAAARLQHPNIVQIHEVGEQAGLPYFSLEYVEGGTLAEQLRGAPQSTQTVARLLEILARAMHYAHEQGIVHRDLKPANVLLARSDAIHGVRLGRPDASGNYQHYVPKITDFGLAKRLDKEVGYTQTGAIMGTPSYMAAEQAEGKIGLIGPATDVYGLGAILYEMLTGRPPFRGETPLDTLQQVLHVEPVSPMQLQPRLPRDLQTICLKCLQKAPRDRYASALDLAEDLRRFLAGEPILARPAGPWERVAKWARRRPAVAALLLVTALATVGFVAGVLVHNAQLQDALHTAKTEKERADNNLQKAREAVTAMLTEVGKEQLAHVPQMESVRKALLEKALLFYQGFLQQQSTDPAVMRETAGVYELAAKMYELLGRHPEMEEALRQALRLQEQLAEQFPHEATYRQDLAETTITQCKLYHAIGSSKQAVESGEKALAIIEQLLADRPSVPAYQHDWATCHFNLGVSNAYLYRLDQAQTHLQEALRVWERLLGEHPGVSDYEDMLAESCVNLGNLYSETGQADKAEAMYRKALPALEHLIGTQPDSLHYRRVLALARDNLGELLSLTQRPAEAKDAYEKALHLRESLARDFPKAFDIFVDLGVSFTHMANLIRDMGRHEASLEWYARALGQFEMPLAQQPRYLRTRESVRNVYTSRAEAFTRLGRHADAVQDWERALEFDDGSSHAVLRLARATSLARLGEHARATDEAKALAEEPQPSGETLCDLAMVYCLAATAAQRDDKLTKGDAEQRADHYASRAVELLVKAERTGVFKNPALVQYVKKHPDIGPIGDREDFKKWLTRVEAKAKQEEK
jgi:tetratricopeptide (TPR) repeat protein